MFKVTKYPHGTFSWVDCASTDAEAGKQFYTALMGWDTEDMPMGDGTFYTFFNLEGGPVAAINPIPPALQAQGMPSVWNSYITVDDVDAMVEKVNDLGGTVMVGPMDIFESGRMLTVQDPTGAVVSLWQPKDHIGARFVNTPGAFTWNELYTRDVAKASDFYSQLLGWEIEKMDGQDYWLGKINGRMNCGIMALTEEFGDMPPNWSVYLSVADIEAATKKAEELGGQVHMALCEAGQVGRFSVIGDPAGATVTLIQLNQPDAWVENA
jgi:uncharacterized protein